VTNEELTAAYQELRQRCIALGRSLTAEQAATMSPCCPEWSVKDLFAHLAGVPVDILEGNTENAATAEWADAQVARRSEDSLDQILDEWEATAAGLDPLLTSMALDIDPRFFFDCWTHEWDLRQALALEAKPDMTLPAFLLPQIAARLTEAGAQHDFDPVAIVIGTDGESPRVVIGDGEPIAELSMSLFEFTRMLPGRRSVAQIQTLGPAANADQLVYFTPASTDIVDPVVLN